MKFIDSITELASRFSKDEVDEKFKTLAKLKYNLAYYEVGKSWDWKELETYGSIVAVPNVEGTVTITSGSRVVSISGASTDWKGRFFRQQDGENLYRIVDVNGNDLTLDQDIIETSGSIDFEIVKIFYTIPSEARRIVEFENVRNRIVNRDHAGLRQSFVDYNNVLRDIPFDISGTDKFASDYATGILVATSGSDVFTGTGTAWLDNVQSGDIVIFGNQEYTVKRVETDTRIISYNKSLTDHNDTYTISKINSKTARMRADFSSSKVVPFTYVRDTHPLVNDSDRCELNRDAELAVLDFAEAYIAESLPLVGWETKLRKAQLTLQSAQANSDPIRSAYKMLPPVIPQGFGRGSI